MGSGDAVKYDAFISYSHTDRSTRIAEALQSGLRRFARPWYRARAARVFRDTTNLAASPQLWNDIQSAMRQSAWFIFVASPDAAQSVWVRREIEWWLANKSVGRLIVVVSDGVLRWDAEHHRFDPASTAVPVELIEAFPDEPLWIDLSSDSGRVSEPILQHGVASIAARLRGVSLDAVFGEHVSQQRRTRATVALVMAALVVLAGGAVAASVVAVGQRNEAVAAADRAASHSLILQSTALRDGQIDRALLAGIGAAALHASPQARANLITTLVGSRYAGTLPGSPSGITAVRFAPAGRLAVTAHVSGQARIWDLTDPARARPVSTIDGEAGAIFAVAIREDGRLLALGTRTSATLWDLADPAAPRLVAELPELYGGVRAVTFDPTGERLYTGGDNIYGVEGEGVRVWDVSRADQPRELRVLPVAALVLDLTLSPSGQTLAIVGTGGIRLWRTTDLVELSTSTAHRDTVYTAAFSPDGATMVTGSQDRQVRVWDVTDPTALRQIAELPEFDKPAFAAEISPDGRTLAVGVGDGSVHTWRIDDPARPTRGVRLPGHADIVDTVAFSADSGLLLSGAGDGRALVWHTGDPTAPVQRDRVRVGTGGPVTSLALASGDTVAALSVAPPQSNRRGPTSLRLHPVDDLRSGTELVSLPDAGGYQVVSVSPDGSTLLSANERSGVSTLRSLAAGPRSASTIEAPGLQVTDVSWSSDGSRLLLGGRQGGAGGDLTLWDVRDRSNPVRVALGPFEASGPSASAMSGDAKLLAVSSGGPSESLLLWDIGNPGQATVVNRRVGSHPAVIRSVAFSPRGGVVATGSNDQTVALWRVPDGQRIAVLDGHELAVASIAFTPDATMLAVLDDSGVITLWDVADPSLPVRLHTVPTGDGDATAFAITADGRRVVVGRDNGDLEVWDVSRIRDIVADPVRVACAITGRGLTEAEWQRYVPERPFRRTC